MGAVAVDMGASGARIVCGWLEDGKIVIDEVEQITHDVVDRSWDFKRLKNLTKKGVRVARDRFKKGSVGIDSWGVDHGFIDNKGKLIQDPIAYRDATHVEQFKRLAGHRRRLFQLTGIQHQPFNTLYQLAARREETPSLVTDARWMILPDLLGHMLTGETNYELTQASTTQLMGLDDRWCAEAFEIIGWPMPQTQPSMPGRVIAEIEKGVHLSSVASHDTASAVCGLGTLEDGDIFLNIGTWSLLGTILERPLATPEAEDGGWTNERMHDGRVRFLKNIPGLFIINRLHAELEIEGSVGQWLASGDCDFAGRFDYFSESLFNPLSMAESVLDLATLRPKTSEQWAGLALCSLIDATASQPQALAELFGRKYTRIRLAGGGSRSEKVCRMLAKCSGLPVVAGPVEATALGNIAMQLVAMGELSVSDATAALDASYETITYTPGRS